MTETLNDIELIGVALPTLRELRSASLPAAIGRSSRRAPRSRIRRRRRRFRGVRAWLADRARFGVDRRISRSTISARRPRSSSAAGWGDVTFAPDDPEGVADVDIGLLGVRRGGDTARLSHHDRNARAFFGRLAGYPVAVMETECSAGARCRFLLGNADVMQLQVAECSRAGET